MQNESFDWNVLFLSSMFQIIIFLEVAKRLSYDFKNIYGAAKSNPIRSLVTPGCIQACSSKIQIEHLEIIKAHALCQSSEYTRF